MLKVGWKLHKLLLPRSFLVLIRNVPLTELVTSDPQMHAREGGWNRLGLTFCNRSPRRREGLSLQFIDRFFGSLEFLEEFLLKESFEKFRNCQVIYSQFGLAIHQNDHQARRRFVEWAQNEMAVVPDFHKRILFSDEAHFWLNGYVNKQNCPIWSEANPQVYVETPLHPEN
ncbi:hypothetical protein TNCV_1840991 [Trichonephila clavipes]|nr:hypothetical protein TNCV_1840991 [Trichonephila clavipes]